MGRMIKLAGVTITDTTAPVIPHTAGVAGYTRRAYAGAIAGNAGDVVSGIPSALDAGATIARQDARAANMTLADDTGIRGVQMPANVSGWGQIFAAGAAGDTNPMTLMAVIKIPVANILGVALNGLALGRAGDGSFSFGTIGGSFGGSGVMLLGGNASWACLIGVSPGGASVAAPVFYANGTKRTTGTLPLVPSTTEARMAWLCSGVTTQVGALIAESVAWPFAFNDTQADAARQAMKAKYPALP